MVRRNYSIDEALVQYAAASTFAARRGPLGRVALGFILASRRQQEQSYNMQQLCHNKISVGVLYCSTRDNLVQWADSWSSMSINHQTRIRCHCHHRPIVIGLVVLLLLTFCGCSRCQTHHR